MQKRVFGVRDFTPRGRSNAIIYAVVLREHDRVVKIGRTTNWRLRRREYDCWNLAPGDAVLCSAVYCVTEHYVDLSTLESACLQAMPCPLYRGKEWFRGSIEDAIAVIEGVMLAADLSFVRLEEVETSALRVVA